MGSESKSVIIESLGDAIAGILRCNAEGLWDARLDTACIHLREALRHQLDLL